MHSTTMSNRRRLLAAVIAVMGLGGALSSAPTQAAGPQSLPGTRSAHRSGHTAPERGVTASTLTAADTAAIAARWGIHIESLRLTASGYMLDFRYHVLDARKAAPLFVRKAKPVLRDDATGMEMTVPVPPKTGALRSSNDPKAGRSYFMFFANPARFIKAGSKVTVTVGKFSVGGIDVTADAVARGAEPARGAARVMTPQPEIAPARLVDHEGRETTLAEAIGGEGPVLVNFIFTSCTTICPVMSTGFAHLQKALGPDRDRVRLVSISIDPETDTVDTLKSYAARYHAGPSWRFYTGTRTAIEAAERAFGTFRGDIANHAAATYLRRTPNSEWEVVDGLSGVDTLVRAYRGEAATR